MFWTLVHVLLVLFKKINSLTTDRQTDRRMDLQADGRMWNWKEDEVKREEKKEKER